MTHKCHIFLEWKEILEYDALAQTDVKRTGISCFALGTIGGCGKVRREIAQVAELVCCEHINL